MDGRGGVLSGGREGRREEGSSQEESLLDKDEGREGGREGGVPDLVHCSPACH